jgi:hypothetical protein
MNLPHDYLPVDWPEAVRILRRYYGEVPVVEKAAKALALLAGDWHQTSIYRLPRPYRKSTWHALCDRAEREALRR